MVSDHDLLIVMNTKLDAFLTKQNDHETRLRRLESYLGKLLGIAIVVSLVIGGGITFVWKKLTGG